MNGQALLHRSESNLLSSEAFRTDLAGELQNVDEATQREIVESTISRISVFFDKPTNRHRLQLILTDEVTQCLRAIEQVRGTVGADSFGSSCESLIMGDDSNEVSGELLQSQQLPIEGGIGCSGDGGINEFSGLAQTPSKAPLTCATWTSGLRVLAVPALSLYQQQLINRIQTLSQDGWTDRQIAKHFNDNGYLTPRGKQWIAQSVFSMRTKWEKRLARISGKW